MNDLLLRPEKPEQFFEMEEIVRDAFWDKYAPGCSEHLVVHRLRTSAEAVPELCLAAEFDGELAGGIWYAHAVIRSGETAHPVLTMGPVCVKNSLQSRGIGAALIRETLGAAAKYAFAVVIYGDPAYYGRFGFHPAEEFGITDSGGEFCPALLVCPLAGGVPAGAFDEGEVYHVTPEEVRSFDRDFPRRRRHFRSSQLFFFPPSPPPADPLLGPSQELRLQAAELLKVSGVLEAWESIGGSICGVGSFYSGLLAKHRDIDLHVYTETLDAARAWKALTPILASPRTRGLDYRNGADTDEACLEWHLRLEDDSGKEWKIDMIQILAGSRYDGVIEDETEEVIDALTPELRRRILALKRECPDGMRICGIEYCRAVIGGQVSSWPEFLEWREKNGVR